MRPNHFIFHCIFFITSFSLQAQIYNVRDFIDSPDRTTKITTQIQQLIDSCHANGGGEIYFPAGEYLTGTIVLKDNVFLNISSGATIYGSKDMVDYLDTKLQSLIFADGADNVGIFGQGTINGQGDSFWRDKEHPYTRPDRFVLFQHCTNVKINDIFLINSPNWCIDVRFCDGVWIDGVRIYNERKSPNTDGIDPVSSKNVFISNCYIETGDDAICPKTRGDQPLENLVVTNCILISDDSAIKFGTRSDSDIRNVVFSNIIIRNSDYGIAFFAKDGGTFENIRFNNIHIETTKNQAYDITKPMGNYPIFLDLERRYAESKLGAVRNIYFNDITIDTHDGHCMFLGQPDSKLENIQLTNISYVLHNRYSFDGKRKPRGVRHLKDKAANDYAHIAAHFSFAHIDGLQIENLFIKDVAEQSQHERRMVWGYDVHNVSINQFSNRVAKINTYTPQIHFNDATYIDLTNCSPVVSDSPFLFLEGKRTANIYLQNNKLDHLKQVVEGGKGFDLKEISGLRQ